MKTVNGMIVMEDEQMLINTASNLTHNLEIDNSSVRINPVTNLDSVTGFMAPTGNIGGEVLFITNPNSSNCLILAHNSSGSLLGNRIYTVSSNNIRIPPRKTVLLKYVKDNTNPGWWPLPGAETNFRYGSTVINTNGSDTVFSIAHGLGYTPTSFSVTFGDARDTDLVNSRRDVNSTNIIITCDSAPVTASLTVHWQVFG